ncbi:MAG: AAA family ATPase, partial [bacterium]|nr:AAA family ATPase [bacterium]
MPITKKVKVLKRIFYSDESGFGVFKVSVKESRDQTIIVGNLFDVNDGDFLEVTGETVNHPKFGDQLKVTSYKSVLPEDKDGIIKYLRTRFHGIGKRIATRIVETYGEETFRVIQESPEELMTIKGMKKSVISEIRKNSKDNETIRALTVKLSPYGIGNETIFKINKEFGDDSPIILEQNAYILIDKIHGIGFKIADTIAIGYGMGKNDPHRIRAGIHFLISTYEQKNGDLYIEEDELTERCATLLAVDDSEVRERIDALVEKDELVREEIPEKVVMSYKNFAIEKMTAAKLKNLAGSSFNDTEVAVDFDHISKKIAIELTEEQEQAVVSAVNNRITIITGGPGTGKTTIIRAIIESFDKASKSVAIAAPTGRAAKRIEEASFFQASTIHRMLKISPETGKFVHNEENPLKADAVIVDEFSMVDFFLFFALL